MVAIHQISPVSIMKTDSIGTCYQSVLDIEWGSFMINICVCGECNLMIPNIVSYSVLRGQINQNTKCQKHTECAPARVRADEQAVQDISCVEEFDCYPFDAASPTLRILQSDIPASPELIRHFLTARQDGESKLQSIWMSVSTQRKSPSMIGSSAAVVSLSQVPEIAKLLVRTSN